MPAPVQKLEIVLLGIDEGRLPAPLDGKNVKMQLLLANGYRVEGNLVRPPAD